MLMPWLSRIRYRSTKYPCQGRAAQGLKPLVHLNPTHIPCLTTQALWLHLIAMHPFALFLGACVGKISNKVGRSAMPWFLAIERATWLNKTSITCASVTFGRAGWPNTPLVVVVVMVAAIKTPTTYLHAYQVATLLSATRRIE